MIISKNNFEKKFPVVYSLKKVHYDYKYTIEYLLLVSSDLSKIYDKIEEHSNTKVDEKLFHIGSNGQVIEKHGEFKYDYHIDVWDLY